MKRIASQVSTSVENTAASASAPSHGGSCSCQHRRQHEVGSLVCRERHSADHPEQHRHEREQQQRRRR